MSATSPAKPEFLLLPSMDYLQCFPYLLFENIICFGIRLLMPFKINLSLYVTQLE